MNRCKPAAGGRWAADRLRHFDGVVQLDIRQYVADTVLRELLDVIGVGRTLDENAVRRQLNVEIAEAIAGSGTDVAFKFAAEAGKIEL